MKVRSLIEVSTYTYLCNVKHFWPRYIIQGYNNAGKMYEGKLRYQQRFTHNKTTLELYRLEL